MTLFMFNLYKYQDEYVFVDKKKIEHFLDEFAETEYEDSFQKDI